MKRFVQKLNEVNSGNRLKFEFTEFFAVCNKRIKSVETDPIKQVSRQMTNVRSASDVASNNFFLLYLSTLLLV